MKSIQTCFPDGKVKALSLSYDDGFAADRRLVSIMNGHGIKGTFHLNSGRLGKDGRIPADEVAGLYAGHEVACHSVTHPTLARCPTEQVMLQVLEDRRRLEDLVGYAVRGFSYPNGSWSKEIASSLSGLGIDYARLVDTTGHFHLTDDPFTWRTTCHHDDNLPGHARRFLDQKRRQALSWFSVWGHSFEFDRNGNWALIEEFCAQAGKQDDVWYATVIDLFDYLRAADGVRVAVSGAFAENPSARPVWLAVDEAVVAIPAGGKAPL
jgi:peptidoglycan/xylan/chitin deacetylase (PgdA/CDA1 family)